MTAVNATFVSGSLPTLASDQLLAMLFRPVWLHSSASLTPLRASGSYVPLACAGFMMQVLDVGLVSAIDGGHEFCVQVVADAWLQRCPLVGSHPCWAPCLPSCRLRDCKLATSIWSSHPTPPQLQTLVYAK